MSPEQIALGAIIILASAAVYFSLRDRYVDLEKHPPEPYDGSLRLTLPVIQPAETGEREDYWKARYPGSKEFTEAFERNFGPDADFCLHAKIVGVNHLNRDGSRRSVAIKRCSPGEILILAPEPDNPEDPLAIAVSKADQKQLGYLEWRVARDVNRDAKRLWIAVFERDFRSAEGAVIGADIILVRLRADIPRE